MKALLSLNPSEAPQLLQASPFSIVESKSYAHRYLIAAALADRPSIIRSNSRSDDVLATVRVLRTLGADIVDMKDCFVITPFALTDQNRDKAIEADCGESGTTLRLLLPVAAALGKTVSFTGRGRLPERPLSPLTDEMMNHGLKLTRLNGLPLTLSGQMRAGDWSLPANVSSQFVSGLLFALSVTEGKSRLTLTNRIESAPYITLTVDVLKAFGADIRYDDETQTFTIEGRTRLTAPALPLKIEGDWSNAAFWCAAAGLMARQQKADLLLPVDNLTMSTLQGDRAILDILSCYGVLVKASATGIRFRFDTEALAIQKEVVIDVSQTPDLLPVAVLFAAQFSVKTRMTGAARLRLKESDRLEAVAKLLFALGIDARTDTDTLSFQGGNMRNGVTVSSFNDHRLVMAAALTLFSTDAHDENNERQIIIEDPFAVNKSYPDFFEHLALTGARLTLKSH